MSAWSRLGKRLTTCPAALALLIPALLASSAVRGAEAAAKRVILDTSPDGDYDDFVTIMAAAVSPEIQLLGVVVTGSRPASSAVTAAKILDLMGRPDVGVYLGDSPPDVRPPFPYMAQFSPRRYAQEPHLSEWAADFHFTPPARSAVDFYSDVLAEEGGVSIVVGGSLTTLAHALRIADDKGQAPSSRKKIEVYFSGGDVKTVEYNVYEDVAAARYVFDSGVTLLQFGGEDEGKARLTHEYRQALWGAQTPATWALQDYYRLYRAGWDPTSPFVPILYDTYPLAYLILGPPVSVLSPRRFTIDGVGHLVRSEGPPNVYSRVSSRPDLLLEFTARRLNDRIQPATNHLRAFRALCPPSYPECSAAAERMLARLPNASADAVAGLLSSLESALPSREGNAEQARWHLSMARQFLLGDHRAKPWNDPYTESFIRRYVPFLIAWKRKWEIVGAALILVCLSALARRWAMERRGRTQDQPESRS